jgi:hypothetical protein
VTLYLHIGLHKTGTSSLQNFLIRNKEALAAAGYLWPRAGSTGGGHHNLGYELLGKPRFAPAAGGLAALAAELEGARNAIVSSEELEFLELAQVRRLREGLGDRRVRVLIYLRRQDELIASTYAQQVRMGSALGTFEEYALASLYNPRFDFTQLLARWGHVFGRESLNVAVVCGETTGERLFADFLARVGLADYAEAFGKPPRSLNVTPGANEVELIRRAARLLRKGGRPLDTELLKRVQQAAAERVAREPDLQTDKLTLDEAMLARAAGRFGAGNHKVAADYVASRAQRAALAFEDDPIAGGRLARGPRLAHIAEEIAAALRQPAEAAHG